MDYIFLECTHKEDCPFDQCCYDQKCVKCPAGCIINVMIGKYNLNIFFQSVPSTMIVLLINVVEMRSVLNVLQVVFY